MKTLLMSAAAAAALLGAPALAQTSAGQAGMNRTQSADWNDNHDWIGAAVVSEDGESIGTVARVSAGANGGDQPDAIIIDTDGEIDAGFRRVSLQGEQATVITADALPQGWSFARDEAGGDRSGGEERRWWNFGGGDSDSNASGVVTNPDDFTLVTVDFSRDDIESMPRYERADQAGSGMTGGAGGDRGETASDGYDRSAGAERQWQGGQNDAGSALQSGDRNEDRPDNLRSGALRTGDSAAGMSGATSGQAGQTGQSQERQSGSDAWNNRNDLDSVGDRDTDGWTDDHPWVDLPVYGQNGEQIGQVERVRGGSHAGAGMGMGMGTTDQTGTAGGSTPNTGGMNTGEARTAPGQTQGRAANDSGMYGEASMQNAPQAIVVEFGGFLDIGGREVELSQGSWSLAERDGEQVLQINHTEAELEAMEPFDESEVSDYPLSDNPLENDPN